MIIATQRPSSDVISGLIKSNIPSRIALSVANAINSRIILDMNGAENLIGKGDMLVKLVNDTTCTRLQGAYIDNTELNRRIEKIKQLYNYSNIIDVAELNKDYTKELTDKIMEIYEKTKSKYETYIDLQKKSIIDLIINDVTKDEQIQKRLYDEYFNIFKDITKYYNGYILEEKAQIKALEKTEKIKRRDRILTNNMLARWLR